MQQYLQSDSFKKTFKTAYSFFAGQTPLEGLNTVDDSGLLRELVPESDGGGEEGVQEHICTTEGKHVPGGKAPGVD